jgi:Spy/CpxP family protein refolding chaperone
MHRKFTLVLACLTAAALVSASVANAQGQRGQNRPYPPGLSEALLMQQRANALELSEESQAKLKVLIDEARPAGEKLQEESGEALAKLHELLDQPLPDEKELIAAGDATGKLAKRMRDQRLETSLRARRILTEEQLAKYMDIRARITVPRQGAGRGRR